MNHDDARRMRWPRRFACVGAGTRIVIVGLVIALSACAQGGGTDGDDAAANGAAETGSGSNGTDAETTGETGAQTTAETASDALAAATAFWAALAARDRQAALSLADPASHDTGWWLFAGPPTLERQFDFYEAIDLRWTLGECTLANDSQFPECTASSSSAWSDALGHEPVEGTFIVRTSDAGIYGVTDRPGWKSEWMERAFTPFEEWVRANHPDDADAMFTGDFDSPEKFRLLEVNTGRFVAAHSGG